MMKNYLLAIAISFSILWPVVSQAANPRTIMMDQRLQKAQHELDLAEKKKGVERTKHLQKNLLQMKENLRLMSENMEKMDRQMEQMIQKYKSGHHRQMASMMEGMVREHIYVLNVLDQMVEGTELRNEILF
ncbi:MAG: hypothetical protein VST70_02510 [Nitrospirota bacterium]|nr:hypothetical protein [Nitrospirota bacterium]